MGSGIVFGEKPWKKVEHIFSIRSKLNPVIKEEKKQHEVNTFKVGAVKSKTDYFERKSVDIEEQFEEFLESQGYLPKIRPMIRNLPMDKKIQMMEGVRKS